MKKFILQLIVGCFCVSTYAQFGPQQIISNNTERAYLSIPLDIDDDGYTDVLKASIEYLDLKWHRNLDGLGNFGPEINITNNTANYLGINFVDIDTDGDKDLIYFKNGFNNICWYENIDGQGNFNSEAYFLDNQLEHITGLITKDVDNDGDIDLLVTYSNTFTGRMVWYKNTDGQANFSDEIVILDENTDFTSLKLVDIDNDNLKDIITAYEFLGNGAGVMAWLKNLGNGIFDEKIILLDLGFSMSDQTSIYSIRFEDINTDQKKDIVFTAHNDDFGTNYFWYENLDNQGNFGDYFPLPRTGKFQDIDNDGDNDILTSQGNRIFWIENIDGLGDFAIEHTITTEVDFLKDIDIADFNGDNLIDVVSASLSDDKVAWYENLGNLSVSENNLSHYRVYPNPTEGFITISSEQKISSIEVYNIIGQKISEIKNQTEIDLSSFDAGIYFIKIMNDSVNSETLKVIKE